MTLGPHLKWSPGVPWLFLPLSDLNSLWSPWPRYKCRVPSGPLNVLPCLLQGGQERLPVCPKCKTEPSLVLWSHTTLWTPTGHVAAELL